MQSVHSDKHRHAVAASPLITVALLWLAGTGMRMTILAVPPLIPRIHADLGMSETEVGILAGLPVALFAAAAIPGSLLIARFGPLTTVVAGLVITGTGSALRGIALDVAALYGATIVTGFGVAVMHPAMPPLVRAWLPKRIGFGTAVYANGLLVGEIIPVMTMVSLLALLGGSWRLACVLWGLPCFAIAALMLVLASRAAPATDAAASGRPATEATAPLRWWPSWNSLLWRLGLMLGGGNSIYFTTNHFLPDYLIEIDRGDLVGSALTALNVGQLPGSLLLLVLAGRLERHAVTYLVFGSLSLVAVLAIIFGNGAVIIAGAALAGFASASVLILILALPPLLSRQEDVPRMAAGMFTISYSCAVIVPIVSGFAWDATGTPAAAFMPLALSTLLMICIAPTLRLSHRIPARA